MVGDLQGNSLKMPEKFRFRNLFIIRAGNL